MFVPVTDLTRVCELILAGLCWYKYMSGKLGERGRRHRTR